MSRILVVSDVHINDYAQRNPSNRFRLYQGSRTVAQNIIEAGRREHCDILVLAGDITEKSVIRPYVQAEIKLFLDTVMSAFDRGFLLLGNHDLDNKSVDQDISDAVLGVMLPPNLYYAHQKTINIDGTEIGFCNWMPEFDLSWIPGKVDVLFTHARICYSTEGGTLFESQVLDESKFDLAICGDIHRAAQSGKYVSIGVPQKCKMGDSDDATGIVFDCPSKNWYWTNLNPNDNLMKFAYTTELDQEGWHEDDHTWYVFKQENATINQDGSIRLDAQNEINSLIDEAIRQSNLQGIHTEVLRNIDNIEQGEIDFNFTLLRLRCENWRSIESIDLCFNPGDRILIQGENGSGKSSLLSALKYAFTDVSDTTGLTSLKPFIQFGKKDCFTEVTFIYQGNECRILRGTKTYEHAINGELQRYNDKRSFEKDVRQRYPFIEYIDAFFFDSSNNQFLGSLSPERETEIVSKFLKLDRIETYNKTATLLSEGLRREQQEKLGQKKELERLLGYISEKLSSISVPSIEKSELERMKSEGLELQRKSSLWSNYQSKTISLQAQIKSAENRLLELRAQVFRDPEIIDQEIEMTQRRIQELQARQVELGSLRSRLQLLENEYQNLRTQGNKAWKEAQSLSLGRTCSLCGQPIQNTEAMEKHRQELLQEVENLRPRIQGVQDEIEKIRREVETERAEYDALSKEISSLNAQVSKALGEKRDKENRDREIEMREGELVRVNEEMMKLGAPEKVELPPDFMQRMAEIEAGITAWTIYETNAQDQVIKEGELRKVETELGNLGNELGEIDSYIKLTGSTGAIYESIMQKLAVDFTNNSISYSVVRKGKGNREHLSLVPNFNNNGNWVPEPYLSSGQHILVDIDFLSHLISSLGVMYFDEFLKSLDAERSEIVIDTIKNLPVGCIFLTSHLESVGAQFHNKILKMELGPDGKTKIELC